LVQVGSLQIYNAKDIKVNGNYAYVLASQYNQYNTMGLFVVDISNYSTPSTIAFFNTTQYPSRIVLNGNYAYIADGDTGLRVIDITNPGTPTQVGFATCYPLDIVLQGNYAYIAAFQGLLIYDISDPTNPLLK